MTGPDTKLWLEFKGHFKGFFSFPPKKNLVILLLRGAHLINSYDLFFPAICHFNITSLIYFYQDLSFLFYYVATELII